MGKKMKKKMIFISISVAVAVIAVAAYKLFNPPVDSVPLQKLQEEMFLYDNWAVFQKSTGSPVMDERVAVYADKMLEEARNSGIGFSEASRYDLGIVLVDFDDDESGEWFRRNSWRFGFNYQGERDMQDNEADFRFVGVFPAEQMYYSGVKPDEYAEFLSYHAFI
ncbi:MAG: hypothetical protein FWH07_00835 [Oscillospiraceae bacterium]|nr:hypothetical protein [Oscillospiraceae bacterium]